MNAPSNSSTVRSSVKHTFAIAFKGSKRAVCGSISQLLLAVRPPRLRNSELIAS